ncbi:MAG: GlsB/YeaQ/YmgE family stress response membrane protein, partial [Chloroflexota bacterium]
MDILVWLIVGGLAGWVASMIMKTDSRQGLVQDILVGIVGAFIGGFVLDFFNITSGQTIQGFDIASFGT